MATTAKRSSSKKAGAKKKSAAAKTTTKKASIKKPANKKAAAAIASKPRQMVTVNKIYKFNLFTALVNIVFAVLSVLFLSSKTVDITLAHTAKDELASSSATVLGPAYEVLAKVELRYILAAIFIISAIFSLLLATRLRAKYEEGVNRKISAWRWIFLGVISGLLLEFATLLGGVQDASTLKLVAGLVFATAVLGWIAEKQNSNNQKDYSVFYLGVFTGVIAWIPLAASLAGTGLYGMQRFGWHVYAFAAVLLLGFISVAFNLYRYIRDGATTEGYLQYEGKYLSNDFLLKLAAFIVILVALYE